MNAAWAGGIREGGGSYEDERGQRALRKTSQRGPRGPVDDGKRYQIRSRICCAPPNFRRSCPPPTRTYSYPHAEHACRSPTRTEQQERTHSDGAAPPFPRLSAWSWLSEKLAANVAAEVAVLSFVSHRMQHPTKDSACARRPAKSKTLHAESSATYRIRLELFLSSTAPRRAAKRCPTWQDRIGEVVSLLRRQGLLWFQTVLTRSSQGSHYFNLCGAFSACFEEPSKLRY